MKKTPPFHVGRGPVPRHASVEETVLAGVRFSRRSSARGGQAPALRAKKGSRHRRAVGTPVPRHAIAHASAHNLCRAGASESDPFGIGRSRTTVSSRSVGPEETFFTGALAGDRPPRYGPRRGGARHRRARACPSPCLGRGNDLGRRAVFAQIEHSRGTGPRATGKNSTSP